MDAKETPTEVVNRASDCCHLCRSPGNLVECLPKIYSKSQLGKAALTLMYQNIGLTLVPLALMYQNIGLTLVNSPSLSEQPLCSKNMKFVLFI